MSLQGSLDTFALPDVLVLLASTKKTGELHVAGTRSPIVGRHDEFEGRVWFDAGRLVGTDVPHSDEPADAIFELLRLAQGTFSFLSGNPPRPGAPVEIEGVLGEAQARLAEWREIEAVVPSLEAWLELAAEPPTAHVSMRGDQWRLVVAIGAGCPVGGAIGHLGLGELPGCRAVKELVEVGLVNLTVDTPAPLPSTVWDEDRRDSDGPHDVPEDLQIVFHTADEDPMEPESTYFDSTPREPGAWSDDAVEPAAWAEPPMSFEPEPVAEPTPAAVPAAVAAAPTPAPAPASVPDWRTELGDLPDLDAVASLPSRPRRRVDTVAEEDPAPAVGTATAAPEDPDALDDGEEPLNRGLLLKFLSSVRN